MNRLIGQLPNGDLVLYDERDEACRYQIAQIRQWDTAERLILLPLSDPRVLMGFGECEQFRRPGAIILIAADGTETSGAEALERILHSLPSGKAGTPLSLLTKPSAHPRERFGLFPAAEPGAASRYADLPADNRAGQSVKRVGH